MIVYITRDSNNICYDSSELYHHGVLGQRWGVRRYQNPDGSYKHGAEGRYDPEPSGSRKNLSGSSSKKELRRQKKENIKTYKKEFMNNRDEYTKNQSKNKNLTKAVLFPGNTAQSAVYNAARASGRKRFNSFMISQFDISAADIVGGAASAAAYKWVKSKTNNKLLAAVVGFSTAAAIGSTKLNRYSLQQTRMKNKYARTKNSNVQKENKDEIAKGKIVDNGNPNVIGVRQKNGDILFVDRNIYNTKGVSYAEQDARSRSKASKTDKEQKRLAEEMMRNYDKSDPDMKEAMKLLDEINK